MAVKKLASKAPGDVVDYPIDFAALLASGETISSALSTVEAGLTDETGGTPGISGSVVTMILSGGVEGETYQIVVSIVTDQLSPFREFERTFCLNVTAL